MWDIGVIWMVGPMLLVQFQDRVHNLAGFFFLIFLLN